MTEKQRRSAKTALTSLALAAGMTLPAVAEVVMPENVPIPRARPYDMSAPPAGVTAFTTGSVVAQSAAAQAANLVVGGDVSRLKSGLDALGSGNAARARSVRDALPANSLDRAILAWAIAVSGDSNVPSTDIAQAARELQGWPGMATLRNNSERALHRENPGPQAVLRAFGDTSADRWKGGIVCTRCGSRLSTRPAMCCLSGARAAGRRMPPTSANSALSWQPDHAGRGCLFDRIVAERVRIGCCRALPVLAPCDARRAAVVSSPAVPSPQVSRWYFQGRHLRSNGGISGGPRSSASPMIPAWHVTPRLVSSAACCRWRSGRHRHLPRRLCCGAARMRHCREVDAPSIRNALRR